MVRYAIYDSPFGPLEIGYDGNFIVCIGQRNTATFHQPSKVSDLANAQLQEYFSGKRKHFDLPIGLKGTPFQEAVWNCMRKIPYGEMRTYGQIAAAIGKPKAYRAVGQAANRNPVWIVVPCHRVVGSNQALTGYAGGLELKRALLNLEKTNK